MTESNSMTPTYAAEMSSADRAYRLTWSWRVEDDDPFAYGRQLQRAWMRRRLPVHALRMRVRATGQLAVILEVQALSSAAVVARWGDFVFQAIQDQALRPPAMASLSVTDLSCADRPINAAG
jgi:hypothetical protein